MPFDLDLLESYKNYLTEEMKNIEKSFSNKNSLFNFSELDIFNQKKVIENFVYDDNKKLESFWQLDSIKQHEIIDRNFKIGDISENFWELNIADQQKIITNLVDKNKKQSFWELEVIEQFEKIKHIIHYSTKSLNSPELCWSEENKDLTKKFNTKENFWKLGFSEQQDNFKTFETIFMQNALKNAEIKANLVWINILLILQVELKKKGKMEDITYYLKPILDAKTKFSESINKDILKKKNKLPQLKTQFNLNTQIKDTSKNTISNYITQIEELELILEEHKAEIALMNFFLKNWNQKKQTINQFKINQLIQVLVKENEFLEKNIVNLTDNIEKNHKLLNEKISGLKLNLNAFLEEKYVEYMNLPENELNNYKMLLNQKNDNHKSSLFDKKIKEYEDELNTLEKELLNTKQESENFNKENQDFILACKRINNEKAKSNSQLESLSKKRWHNIFKSTKKKIRKDIIKCDIKIGELEKVTKKNYHNCQTTLENFKFKIDGLSKKIELTKWYTSGSKVSDEAILQQVENENSIFNQNLEIVESKIKSINFEQNKNLIEYFKKNIEEIENKLLISIMETIKELIKDTLYNSRCQEYQFIEENALTECSMLSYKSSECDSLTSLCSTQTSNEHKSQPLYPYLSSQNLELAQ